METLTPEGRRARAAYVKQYNAGLTEEQRKKRREYMRKWRRANKDRIRETSIRFWNKRGAQMAQEAAEADTQ